MIDFHTHVLPNIDDGSHSIVTSINMLENASKQGVCQLVCTPHFWPLKATIPEFLQRRALAEGLLKSAIEGRNHPERLPFLKMGAECGWVKNISNYPDLEALCIEDTAFLLLELPMGDWTDEVFEELYRLNTRRGIYPVIAHPNRYAKSIKACDALQSFAELDCLFQVDVNSVLRLTERTFNFRLLTGFVPCVLGSDMHDGSHKAQRMGKALQTIEKQLGAETVRQLSACSAAALQNGGMNRLRSLWSRPGQIPQIP